MKFPYAEWLVQAGIRRLPGRSLLMSQPFAETAITYRHHLRGVREDTELFPLA